MVKQRTRAWWERTVARWRRSGRTASEFAEREGLQVGTLRWWSSRLGRDTRAQHGAVEIKPIEISVSGAGGRSAAGTFEVMVGDAVLRCDVGTDVEYVATLVRTLRGS